MLYKKPKISKDLPFVVFACNVRASVSLNICHNFPLKKKISVHISDLLPITSSANFSYVGCKICNIRDLFGLRAHLV